MYLKATFSGECFATVCTFALFLIHYFNDDNYNPTYSFFCVYKTEAGLYTNEVLLILPTNKRELLGLIRYCMDIYQLLTFNYTIRILYYMYVISKKIVDF